MSRKRTVLINVDAPDPSAVPENTCAAHNVLARCDAHGSIGARIAALEAYLRIAESCRCEPCFILASAARERIAVLESWCT